MGVGVDWSASDKSRYAARVAGAIPMLALTAALTLAISIGANTTVSVL